MKRKKFVLMFMLLLVIFMTGCQKKTYLVTFVDYDDTILVEVEVEEGKSVSAPTDLFREGYTFTGWDESLDNITQTSIIKATYQINVFTVDFYDYDNTLLKSQGVNYQGSATAPTNPTRTGYEFTGWSVDFTNITANLTVNAVYELNEYTIIFKDFDGTTLKEQTVSYGQSATAPEVPEREGYSFLEWSEDFSVITDNLTIDAMYEIYTCVVSFVDEDDAVLKIETVSYLESATAPVDPQKPGYIFSGWDKDYTSITSTLQVKATYTPIEYSLIYHANNSESVLSSTQWTTKEIFVADFYTDYFTWLQNHVEDIPELSLSGSTYSLTKNGATATWSDVTSLKTIDKYVFEKTLSNYIYAPIVRPSSDDQPVVPVVNNGYFLNSEPYRSKFIELDGYFLKALITSYSGYDRSYTPTSAGKIQIFFRFQQWVQGTTITGFTYFDQFSRYDVTTFGNVTLPENRTFTVEDTTALPNPTYSGVDFLGWYTHPNGKGAPVTSVEGISESIDLYAFWDTDAANNTLRYYDLDGSLLKMETIATGVTPTPPTISPKEGYVFTGWDKSLTSVVTNLSLTAVYSKIAYTLTYDDNEATLDIPVPEALTYYADENLTLEHITYDGYYFLGWYLNSACTTSITQTTTGNIRVYAKWVKVPASGETVGDGTLIAVIDDATIQVGLSANVYGSTTTGYIPCSELTYSSSDETIATVSPEGFVIGKSDGTITILIARGAQLATVELTVASTRSTVAWVGHQGAAGPFVQNTVEAYVGGAQRGYYALECDVRVSADGVYYICHDDVFLSYLFVDSSYHNKLMGGYSWTELSSLQLKDTYEGQTYYSTLATVEEYLNVCKQYNVKAVLELKYTNGINSSNTSRLGGLVDLVKECGMYDHAIFMTSMTACLNYLRTNYPDAQLQFLSGSSSTSVATAHWCVENRLSLDAANNLLTKEIIDIVHAGGLYVNAYTVDDSTTATQLYEMGVDMITTNLLGQPND